MKKTISIILVIGAALMILDSMSASHWIVLFLLAGVIPGTDIVLSPVDMMAAVATALTIIVLRITAWPLIRAALETPTVLSPAVKRGQRRII